MRETATVANRTRNYPSELRAALWLQSHPPGVQMPGLLDCTPTARPEPALAGIAWGLW
eukprot:CAMPEP_0183331684 /NCGR_PEP_ID=MMETSP0164_2-20130417/1001_1 /TAXON_ID=221442 /ORGANISM="Coccolithus pelagicus ssp braarudi, Strain PLY182g" /LENGTH=57 /DNA_ID=CAMNT_0025500229 /DNA_START=139 /DNA_END=312 /DNA_ORIENTATION=+